MKLIIGLGNPGSQYEETRHNIGFQIVSRLAELEGIKISKKGFSSFWSKGAIGGRDVLFLLPQTYMNRSGTAVREVRDYYHIENADMVAVHDDLDFPLGRLKPDFEAGAGGHRGVASMIEVLGTKAFHRLRVGIGRPALKEEVEGYVLSRFDRSEFEVLQETISEAVEILKGWILT